MNLCTVRIIVHISQKGYLDLDLDFIYNFIKKPALGDSHEN